jgi:hypothetical protein
MLAAPVTADETVKGHWDLPCTGAVPKTAACSYIVRPGGMAMGLSYDRRVPEELLKALEPGGFAHSLVEFGGSGMWALDLQLRGLGQAKNSTGRPCTSARQKWLTFT